jgi:hypothetical protein
VGLFPPGTPPGVQCDFGLFAPALFHRKNRCRMCSSTILYTTADFTAIPTRTRKRRHVAWKNSLSRISPLEGISEPSEHGSRIGGVNNGKIRGS